MSAPNDGYSQYPPQHPGEQQQPPYPDQRYENASPAPDTGSAAHLGADHGKKKKRQYAASAFDVGVGGNVQAGAGQVPGATAPYGIPPTTTPAYGGYPQPDLQPAVYGAPVPQPPYGQPPAVGGYQAPEPYYPSAGAPPAPGGVAGLTAGMQSMNLAPGGVPGIPQQQPQQLPPQARAGPLNQLYPTDLLNQPFNVSELDLPPPPIILPPNVGLLLVSLQRNPTTCP